MSDFYSFNYVDQMRTAAVVSAVEKSSVGREYLLAGNLGANQIMYRFQIAKTNAVCNGVSGDNPGTGTAKLQKLSATGEPTERTDENGEGGSSTVQAITLLNWGPEIPDGTVVPVIPLFNNKWLVIPIVGEASAPAPLYDTFFRRLGQLVSAHSAEVPLLGTGGEGYTVQDAGAYLMQCQITIQAQNGGTADWGMLNQVSLMSSWNGIPSWDSGLLVGKYSSCHVTGKLNVYPTSQLSFTNIVNVVKDDILGFMVSLNTFYTNNVQVTNTHMQFCRI